jgi:hypothetical protein
MLFTFEHSCVWSFAMPALISTGAMDQPTRQPVIA